MKYLIDTQVFIWSLISPAKLSREARQTLQQGTVYVSIVSLYEIAIRPTINKLPDFTATTDELIRRMQQDGFELMPLLPRHVARNNTIPLLPDHRDPFDRMLLATALAEQIPLISADGHFGRYADLVTIIW